MAVLTDAQIKEGCNRWMEAVSKAGEQVSILKNDVTAAYTAMDGWINANAQAMNQAIPQPARANLTQDQKARMLMDVVAARYLNDVA
jgi:hypothetical protein